MVPTPNPLVATFGEPLLRLGVGAGNRLDRAGHLDLAVGGAELNVAIALAALGRRSRYISAVPDTTLGERVVTELRSRGVLVDHVGRVPDARLGLYFVEHAGPPRAHQVTYDRAGSAFTESTFTAAVLDDVDTLVISGITAALGQGPADELRRLVNGGLERGIRIVLDVNHRELLWPPEVAAPALAPLLRSADVVICARRDAARLFDAHSAEALRDDHAPQAELVVMTDGSNGASAASADTQCSVEAPATVVIDRFGAGDAFTAGLVWSLTAGHAAPDALAAGTALAAMACTVTGDIAAFSERELLSVLADPAAAMVR